MTFLKYVIIICFSFVLLLKSVLAQELYTPRQIKSALSKETRAADGRPGKNYWQNFGNYHIQISLNPPDRLVHGIEKIVYHNNSPDTLKALVIKLIMNIHKQGAARFAPVDSSYLTSGVKINSLIINGKRQNFKSEVNNTNQIIPLLRGLAPRDSLNLDVTWEFQLASTADREGQIDSSTFFLGYFYPRIAVYDDYNGWDKLDFLDSYEFYNDFNDYTLEVKVPGNYLVWATGQLQNPDQVLKPKYAERLKSSYSSDSIIHIIKEEDLAEHNVTAAQKVNTWIWTAKYINDVAFGVSDHYVWDAASTVVDPKTGRRASLQAAYISSSFSKSVKLGQHTLNWYSENWPGLPYPYSKMTVFEGGKYMEFPMMCNDRAETAQLPTQFIQDHEMAHTYFPFYMGINESRYAFMDEGWATALEYLIGISEHGKTHADEFFENFRVKDWSLATSASSDLPVITPTNELSSAMGGGQWFNSYTKPALCYLALRDLLGDQSFKIALLGYMERWHGKHPTPWDFFNCINNISGRNLNWFFENWFFTSSHIDLSLTGIKEIRAHTWELTVNNLGGFAIPFNIQIVNSDGTSAIMHETPAAWQHGGKEIKLIIKSASQVQSVKITTRIFMDSNEGDNSLSVNNTSNFSITNNKKRLPHSRQPSSKKHQSNTNK